MSVNLYSSSGSESSSGPPTQKKIALLSGVSTAVVSRVLSGSARNIGISESTIKKVLEKAREVDYRPNPGVSIMQGRKTRLMGVIVRNFEDPFLGIILDEINREAHAAGLNLLIKGFEGGQYNDAEMQSLLSYAPDALILVGTMDFKKWDPAILNSNKLIVQIGARANHPSVISCGMDEASAARQIANHLGELGHQGCAIIGNISVPTSLRTERLLTAFKANGIKCKRGWQSLSESSYFLAGKQAAEEILGNRRGQLPFSAVVALGDTIAMGFIKAAENYGVRFPKALSLCSYNNLEFASFTTPSLTTIHQPLREMAQTAIRIASGAEAPKTIRIKPSLIVRESSAKKK